jgi:ornithine--oxo-acid transaminase
MRAGLSTLDILERENLGPRAASAGRYLRQALGERLAKYEMFGEVRGVGLLSGIEFKPPRSIKLRLAFEACAGIHPALFGQMIVMRMFRDHGILNQVCGNDFMVLKVSPPLTVENDRLDRYVDAIEQVMESVHGSGAFWAESLSIARRVIASI